MTKARTRARTKSQTAETGAGTNPMELRDSMGRIRLPEIDPEDVERNDRRELQFLQRQLAALHYQEHERPAVLAKIAELKEILSQHERTSTGVAPEELAVR
jgi:hypothetical protein